jgi:uncharacterized protein YndB with AHSA1/START domain/DNA-binding transcriptional ArsR family regulator
MAQVFRALADPTRRQLLDRLHADNGQTLGALCHGLAATRQAVTQHLSLLESAGLISTVRRGREKLHYLNPVPLRDVQHRWIAKFERLEVDALQRVRAALEGNDTVEKPSMVHVIYIDAPIERVWEVLTDTEHTGKFWGHRVVSGWSKGDSWEMRKRDGQTEGVGTILEIDPPHRLSHSWGWPSEVDSPELASRATYDLEQVGSVVRLTVTHENLRPEAIEPTNSGWSMVLSSLKSYVETGTRLIDKM